MEPKKRRGKTEKTKAKTAMNRGLFGGGCCTNDPKTVWCSGCGYKREEPREKLTLPSPRFNRDKDWLRREYAKMPKTEKAIYEELLQMLKPFEKHPLQAANLAMELTTSVLQKRHDLTRFYAACKTAEVVVGAGKHPPIW